MVVSAEKPRVVPKDGIKLLGVEYISSVLAELLKGGISTLELEKGKSAPVLAAVGNAAPTISPFWHSSTIFDN